MFCDDDDLVIFCKPEQLHPSFKYSTVHQEISTPKSLRSLTMVLLSVAAALIILSAILIVWRMSKHVS